MASTSTPGMKTVDIPVITPLKPLPFHMQFAAGGIAGVSEILVMYPLDVVKTRFQLQVGKATGPEAYTSIADCLRKIIKKEGGIGPPVLIEAPKRAIKFAANEHYTKVYLNLFGMDKVNQPLSVLTGISAGCTEASMITSFELVKIRMQDKNNAGLYKNSFDVVRKVFQHEGFFGFFKGLEATIWRHAIWNGAYFGMIHQVRSLLPESDNKNLRNFIAGTIGGTIATSLNTPFDVIKTRVQSQRPGLPVKYGWAFGSIATIVREEGYFFNLRRFGALYKGFMPKVLRLGPGGGILLLVFEQVSHLMREYLL